MKQRIAHTVTDVLIVGRIMTTVCGVTVARRDETMDGQMTIFDYPECIPNGMARIIHGTESRKIEEQVILRGSGFRGGKDRIREFFAKNSSRKEQSDFLKNEYGVGCWGMDECTVMHDSKGINIHYKETETHEVGQVTDVHIGWPMVALSIERLISEGRY